MISEGWNIGSVTIRRVRVKEARVISVKVQRHGGDIAGTIQEMLADPATSGDDPCLAAVTGPLAGTILDLPYLPESICIEKAVQVKTCSPDIVLSLGGESFVVYCMSNGRVRNMVSSSRCAAGSGEFILQQFSRMGLQLDEGLRQAQTGEHVPVASRCSVHIKSDATHRLNKGTCTPADIAYTLVVDLAVKINTLVESTAWPHQSVLIIGGMAQNHLLVTELQKLLPGSQVETCPESPYFEAFGAALAAQSSGNPPQSLTKAMLLARVHAFETLPPLSEALRKVVWSSAENQAPPRPGMRVLLGIDAGSTTTKAALLEAGSGRMVAACYLRTHGNPVAAANQCLENIRRQIGDCPLIILQVAATGSGRELVSVAFGNCLSFNEILAHARAARAVYPEVDTIFEIGGQDAKYIALQSGVPVDYAMNDGCSAGTGSFLEEAAASDMKYKVEEIGRLALQASRPLSFNERCAAFINSEIRTALQSGEDPRNILAGLVYSIVKNYLSRVVGTRFIGNKVLLQGGVALNPAVAPAIAALSNRTIILPPQPELMGCIGSAWMALDLIRKGDVPELALHIQQLQKMDMAVKNSFQCTSCQNHCEVQRIQIGQTTYPFGGLCSRWEMLRRPQTLRSSEGQDLTSLRSHLMFEVFTPARPERPIGRRVGLPLALSTYELYPFYAKLLAELDLEIVLSRPGQGRKHTHAPFCYPAELLHAAVDDLLSQGVDWIFLPQIREFPILGNHAHAYSCSFTQDSAGVIRNFFSSQSQKLLTPEIGLSEHLLETSQQEIIRMASRLPVPKERARLAFHAALEHQARFEEAYHQEGAAALSALQGPKVILVGRPYAAYNPAVNLSLPRKIASRGFHVIPADLLGFHAPSLERNVWRFTQVAENAVHFARRNSDAYVCFLSSFSCNPDAIAYHRLLHELEGRPFCFLEIDSHTADAGIDTRIGAFLDIIEERRQMGKDSSCRVENDVSTGQINASGKHPRVITRLGEVLGFDNPRVVHVLLADLPPITSRLFVSLYSRMGWRCKVTPPMNASFLQAARQVCSGRECLPFLAMIGKMVSYLEKRDEGEVTLFHMLEQEGPCQIGNWFDASQIILNRMGVENAFPVWPRITNNYLGGGEPVAIAVATACVLGDLMYEVRSAITCLAKDPPSAFAILDDAEDRLVRAAERGLPAIEWTMRQISQQFTKIPLASPLAALPKILLFSGINRIFVDRPVRDFFQKKGILCKTSDTGEFLCFYESEPVVRRGFALGCQSPRQHFAPLTLVRGILRNPTRQARFEAARAAVHVTAIEWLDHHWRSLLSASGLIFAPDFHYQTLLNAGHEQVSVNGWTEAPCTAGRYLTSLQEGVFDAYVNIGAFNCTPASNATAVTHGAAFHSDLPYALIEADGSNLTASQLRQLETVASQCLERKAYPTMMSKKSVKSKLSL